MGARSRRKGAAWEREVASRFQRIGIEAERSLTECRDGNTGDLVFPGGLPLAVQAKVGARPRIYPAVAEAEEAAKGGQVPVAIIRRNGSGSRPPDDLAVLPVRSFVRMVELLVRAGVWPDERPKRRRREILDSAAEGTVTDEEARDVVRGLRTKQTPNREEGI